MERLSLNAAKGKLPAPGNLPDAMGLIPILKHFTGAHGHGRRLNSQVRPDHGEGQEDGVLRGRHNPVGQQHQGAL